jgi:hypothetical protein
VTSQCLLHELPGMNLSTPNKSSTYTCTLAMRMFGMRRAVGASMTQGEVVCNHILAAAWKTTQQTTSGTLPGAVGLKEFPLDITCAFGRLVCQVQLPPGARAADLPHTPGIPRSRSALLFRR